MNWKKFTLMMLAIATATILFSGCKSGTGTNEENSQEGSTQSSVSEANGTVYYLNFKPEQAQDWLALAKIYEGETGVRVNVQTAASNGYEATLKSEMAKTAAPTLFQVNGPVGLNNWRDYCYDLADSEIYSHLKSDDFALKEGDKVYGIAYAIETYGIIYNKEIMDRYLGMDDAVIEDISEINNFESFKRLVEDIQDKKEDLGINGAFTSAGMDSSSDWRFKTHLANLPIYYEYQDDNITQTGEIKGTYLDEYKQIWDLYINNATCPPSMLSGKTGSDAEAEFALGEAMFFQNGTWEYQALMEAGMGDEDLGMLPIYIGVEGEENQGLCTGSENYWCVNSKASSEDIQATLDFLNWLVTSDEGRDSIANTMGFVTPFDTFDEDAYQADNALIKAANEYIDAGKTSVSWNFATIPSEQWKNGVGNALLEYAQGTGEWSAVENAFITGWKTEYDATNQGNATDENTGDSVDGNSGDNSDENENSEENSNNTNAGSEEENQNSEGAGSQTSNSSGETLSPGSQAR